MKNHFYGLVKGVKIAQFYGNVTVTILVSLSLSYSIFSYGMVTLLEVIVGIVMTTLFFFSQKNIFISSFHNTINVFSKSYGYIRFPFWLLIRCKCQIVAKFSNLQRFSGNYWLFDE